MHPTAAFLTDVGLVAQAGVDVKDAQGIMRHSRASKILAGLLQCHAGACATDLCPGLQSGLRIRDEPGL